MYNNLGPHWAGTLVACLAVIFVPVPLLLHRYGAKIRRMTKPGRDADDLGHMMVKMMAAQKAASAAPITSAEDKSKVDEESVIGSAIENAPRLDSQPEK